MQQRKKQTMKEAMKEMNKEHDFTEPLDADKDHSASYDPTKYGPHQLKWFREVSKKDIKFYVLYVIAFGVFVYMCEPCPAGHWGTDGRLLSNAQRVWITVFFGFMAVITLYIDIVHGSPPEPGDRKWRLLLDGVSGHFSYLTVNILTLWAVYWSLAAITEVLWAYDDSEIVRQMVTAVYSFAVISSAFGTVLTLLFLKFNWYNESWRKETLEMYERRGNTKFRTKILFTHLNQLPIAFFDVVVLKQNHYILLWATPSLFVTCMGSLAYAVGYLIFTHFNYRVNGQVYPYSFMDTMLVSWKVEIMFILVLAVFIVFVTAFYYFIAVEADYVESAIWKRLTT